jgi:hypothetical protein
VGRGRSRLQDHRARRALSRRSAGSTSGGFSRNWRLSVAIKPTGFKPVVV